jgi:hypothetical protein
MLGEVFMSYKEYKDVDGYLHKQWRNKLGEHHREDGPAHICYNPNGSINSQSFYINGHFHREDGPANILYDSYGNICYEGFFRYGRHHSEMGAAQIWYNRDGSINEEFFCFKGEHLGKDNVGFWRLWEILNEVERQAPAILKFLARYS